MFKHQCVDIYRKLNYEAVETFTEVTAKSQTNESTEIYIENIVGNETALETTMNEESEQIQMTNDEEQEYEDVYLEFDVEEGEEEEEMLDVDEKPKNSKNIMNRKSYTVAKKLQIIEYAEEHNNRVAARFFNMNESSVRCFRRQKEILLKMSPLKKTNRKAFPHWPKLEAELKEFVLNHTKVHGIKAKLKDIKEHAIEISKKHGIENFNGSNSYIFKFMQRHQLPSASPRPRKNRQDLAETLKKEVV